MTNLDSQIPELIALNTSFTIVSSNINDRDLILKDFYLLMFKEFRCPVNTDKVFMAVF